MKRTTVCGESACPTKNRRGGAFNVACPICGGMRPVVASYLRPWRDFLAPRMPEGRWLKACNIYRGWRIWHQWTGPTAPLRVESRPRYSGGC